MIPDPGVLDRLIRDRQNQLRARNHPAIGSQPERLRIRVGHLLIAVGSSLSGERVEMPARPPALPKAA